MAIPTRQMTDTPSESAVSNVMKRSHHGQYFYPKLFVRSSHPSHFLPWKLISGGSAVVAPRLVERVMATTRNSREVDIALQAPNVMTRPRIPLQWRQLWCTASPSRFLVARKTAKYSITSASRQLQSCPGTQCQIFGIAWCFNAATTNRS
jgi:hypothetical protein